MTLRPASEIANTLLRKSPGGQGTWVKWRPGWSRYVGKTGGPENSKIGYVRSWLLGGVAPPPRGRHRPSHTVEGRPRSARRRSPGGVRGEESEEVSGARSWVVPFQQCGQSPSQPNRPVDPQSYLHGPTKYAKRLSPPRGLVPRPRGAKKGPKLPNSKKCSRSTFRGDLLLRGSTLKEGGCSR